MISPISRQKGLSIVELMVALTLGLILTAGLVQIFAGNQRSFIVGEASNRVQETGRMTTEILNQAVRNADYWGCIPRGAVANKLDDTDPAYQAAEDLFSFSDGFYAYQSDGTTPGLAGTDALILRGVGGSGNVQITEVMPNSSANLKVNTVAGIAVSDILLISDCIAGDIFQVTHLQTGANPGIGANSGGSVKPGNSHPRGGVDVTVDNNCPPGNPANCMSKQYDQAAQIYNPYYYRFFPERRCEWAPGSVPAKWRGCPPGSHGRGLGLATTGWYRLRSIQWGSHTVDRDRWANGSHCGGGGRRCRGSDVDPCAITCQQYCRCADGVVLPLLDRLLGRSEFRRGCGNSGRFEAPLSRIYNHGHHSQPDIKS
nr:prepilin-type N-terminal cleavage/methylation domain-containing protein [Marinobacter sp. X15-166B]